MLIILIIIITIMLLLSSIILQARAVSLIKLKNFKNLIIQINLIMMKVKYSDFL